MDSIFFLSVCVPFYHFYSFLFFMLSYWKETVPRDFLVSDFFPSKRAPSISLLQRNWRFFLSITGVNVSATLKSGVCFFPLIFRQQVMASCWGSTLWSLVLLTTATNDRLCQWHRRLIYRRSTIYSPSPYPVSFTPDEEFVLENLKFENPITQRKEEKRIKKKYSLKIWWHCLFETCFIRRDCSWIHIWRSSPLTKWFKNLNQRRVPT